MTRMTPFSNPLLLGFDTMEKTLERVAKSGDSYPPYNIERTGDDAYRISIAVAGFSNGDIAIETKENSLVVKGAKPARPWPARRTRRRRAGGSRPCRPCRRHR